MPFPAIDPVFLTISPLEFRWYGLMYLVGLLAAFFIIARRSQGISYPMNRDMAMDFVVTLAIGVILGGRLGYMLFYDTATFFSNPLQFFKIWQGGMSFHGGIAGVAIAGYWYARQHRCAYLLLADFVAFAAPVGLGLGRIANFINGELYGRVTSLPFGVVFPLGGPLPRHPSQLYEAFLEGVVLFVLVRLAARLIPKRTGIPFAVFLIGYGVSRFLVEIVREPDRQIGLLFNSITMGQLLSLPLIFCGLILFITTYRTTNRQ